MEANLKRAARDCIQTRYADLTSAIKNATPTTIGNDLVQVGMVSDDITDFEPGLNKNDQASKIMRVVSSTVQVTPESIMKFIKVLCDSKDPTCNDLGKKMKKESTCMNVTPYNLLSYHWFLFVRAQWRKLVLQTPSRN